MKKRSLIVILISLLTSGIISAGFVFAETEQNLSTKEVAYQLVIDKLNEEYGTKVHRMTSDEQKKLGIKTEPVAVSLTDFENELRIAIIEDRRANREALAQIVKAGVSDIKMEPMNTRVKVSFDSTGELSSVSTGELSSVSTGELSSLSRVSSTATIYKIISGCSAYLQATASNAAGYWKFTSFGSTWTTWVNGRDSTPIFVSSTYGRKYLDGSRTCAIKYSGYTMDKYGNLINSNASRYVEFYAGSWAY
jgi:hypothetical protein